jgi:hypothetical protein
MGVFSAISALGFLAWGVIFGAITFSEYMRASAQTSLGVGTSSAVSMTILMWIAGLIFFGLNTLIFKSSPNVASADSQPTRSGPTEGAASLAIGTIRPVSDEPIAGDRSHARAARTEVYKECRYAVHGDDRVVAKVDGKPMTWQSEQAFKSWVDRHPDFQ